MTERSVNVPVAYVIRSLRDGSIFDQIAPVGYSMFEQKMKNMLSDSWVMQGRAEIVPLYAAAPPEQNAADSISIPGKTAEQSLADQPCAAAPDPQIKMKREMDIMNGKIKPASRLCNYDGKPCPSAIKNRGRGDSKCDQNGVCQRVDLNKLPTIEISLKPEQNAAATQGANEPPFIGTGDKPQAPAPAAIPCTDPSCPDERRYGSVHPAPDASKLFLSAAQIETLMDQRSRGKYTPNNAEWKLLCDQALAALRIPELEQRVKELEAENEKLAQANDSNIAWAEANMKLRDEAEAALATIKSPLGNCDECGTPYVYDATDDGSVCVPCLYAKLAGARADERDRFSRWLKHSEECSPYARATVGCKCGLDRALTDKVE